ncbi:MarR family winged helix-turn-helix transcriptional regulator [Sphingomonas sp. ID0503]|uniref:MarR family winged helix-turn-helix transcriptional regulator n=1 Tax=Sphingomonas sp. ID0503 TaxID=3399691 RepID=UPI003AFAF66C
MAAPTPIETRRAASPLFLREAEIRRGVELLYFGYSHLYRGIDTVLAEQGLGRAHHRALYFISTRPDLTVSELLRILAITKQSLGRVLNDLTARGLVESRVGQVDRRQRRLRLTPEGRVFESNLFEALRAKLSEAYASAGQEAVTGFWDVLEGLIPREDRGRVAGAERG